MRIARSLSLILLGASVTAFSACSGGSTVTPAGPTAVKAPVASHVLDIKALFAANAVNAPSSALKKALRERFAAPATSTDTFILLENNVFKQGTTMTYTSTGAACLPVGAAYDSKGPQPQLAIYDPTTGDLRLNIAGPGTVTTSTTGGPTTGGTASSTTQACYSDTDLVPALTLLGGVNYDIVEYQAIVPTITTLAPPSPNPARAGQSVNLAATVTDNANNLQFNATVNFFDGSKQICTGQSNTSFARTPSNLTKIQQVTHTCTVTFSTVGDHSITAVTSTANGYRGSTSNAQTLTITPAVAPTVTVSTSPNPGNVNSTVTLTATVLDPGLTAPNNGVANDPVTFTATQTGGGTPFTVLCGRSAQPTSPTDNAGTATCDTTFPTTGTYSITASVAPYNGYTAASSSNTVTQVILPAPLTTALYSGTNFTSYANGDCTAAPPKSGTTFGTVSTQMQANGDLAITVTFMGGLAAANQQFDVSVSCIQRLSGTTPNMTNSAGTFTSPTYTFPASMIPKNGQISINVNPIANGGSGGGTFSVANEYATGAFTP
ncbi:MAG: Ig-like domain-containing protein [Candidatus Eremiobacteraeota bacterium]|nr:Ig-like domain-containing protein [Candidatus Eremiobacteraeota bacterium]